MASERTSPDADSPPDPFEAELVAYLDGELDEATARQVEARLARDPAARSRAAELKKSFDLLDYLPRAEPSPTFTTRTIDKLPTVKPGADSSFPREAPGTKTAPASVSTSMPVPLEPDPAPVARPDRSRGLLWAGGLFVLITAFAAIGYIASAVASPYLFPTDENVPGDVKLEPEPRVIEYLPVYAVADDITFVNELAKPEHFGEDPAVAFDPTLKIPPADTSDKPAGQQFESLSRMFRALPSSRQAEIVKLDQDLHAKEPKERQRLFRVLEAYAAWLGRLSESDRRRVLSATNPEARLEIIRKIRDQQWVNSLPEAVRSKPELIQQWREEEATRRDRWAFIRQHSEAFAANKSPWPFDTESGRKQVMDFARVVFKTEDLKRCRLSLSDLADYKRTLETAERDDNWAWYGLLVYELNRTHPYLPEPENAKSLITDLNDLPDVYQLRLNPKKGFGPRPRLNTIGKWPEFPLEVLQVVQLREGPFVKGPIPQLGPSRLSEYKQPVREFANQQLFPKMTADEKRELQGHSGKWPDYPQRLIHYAQKYDLSIPGVMLPGSPKKWDSTYGIRSGPRPGK